MKFLLLKKVPLICFILWVTANVSFSAIKKEDFRKGIKSHEDWVNRLLETGDPRILYLLQSRCGYVTSLEQSKKICQAFSGDSQRFESFLRERNILGAFDGLYDKKAEEWKAKYPKNYIAKSKYYYVFGHATQKNETIKIAKFMDKIYELYRKKFKSDEKVAERFFVKVYPNERDFKKTLSAGSGFAYAYYSGADRELVCHLDSPKELLRVLQTLAHEGFHQFLGYYVPNPPIWLNEGMAEYFEGLDPRERLVDSKKTINRSDLQRMKAFLKQDAYVPLKRFIYMSQEEYYSNPGLHYAQGWSLIYFLAYASKSYNKYFQELIQYLKNGYDREPALDATFGKVDFDKMERIWKKYILDM